MTTSFRQLNSLGVPLGDQPGGNISRYSAVAVNGQWTWPQSATRSIDTNSAWTKEQLQSINHPYPYKEGGPFSVKRYSAAAPWIKHGIGATLTSGRLQHNGYCRFNLGPTSSYYKNFLRNSPLSFNGSNASSPVLDSSSLPPGPINLSAYGVKAYSRFAPTKPIASFGQSLYEIHEIPQMIRNAYTIVSRLRNVKDKRKYADILSSEYLGFNFGWVPFIDDLATLLTLQSKLHQSLAQLRRDNGRGVRRSGELLNTQDIYTQNNVTFDGINGGGVTVFNGVSTNFVGTIDYRLTKRIWFSARYVYYIPDLGPNRVPIGTVLKLLGLYPSADVLWSVIKWTWLLDWVTNVGDNLRNISSGFSDNLSTDYAYIMEHDELSAVYTAPTQDWYGKPTNITGSLHAVSKVREESSPFGFNLQPGTFSAFQWAILGALGITRRRSIAKWLDSHLT